MVAASINKKAARPSGGPPFQNRSRLFQHNSESLQQWTTRVLRAAQKLGYIMGRPTNLIQDVELDDEVNNYVLKSTATKALKKLKEEFLTNIALAFGDGGTWTSPTIGYLHEDPSNGVVTIGITRMDGTGECAGLLDTAAKFAVAFTGIHQSAGSKSTADYDSLEEIVFRLYRTRLFEAAGQLRSLWRIHAAKLYEVIAMMSGMYDEDIYEARDVDIGDCIIGLNGSIHSLGGSTPTASHDHDKHLKEIVFESLKLFYVEGGWVQARLRNILGSSLGSGIYNAVLVMVQPTRSVETFLDWATYHHPAKESVVYLRASVLGDRIPDPSSDAYYAFGFVALQDEDKLQKLGGLWKAIFMDSPSENAVLVELCQALSEHHVAQFFDRHGWSTFRYELPSIETFFATPPNERTSVYRLVQFIRVEDSTDEGTEPPRVLIRDYGFHLCKQRGEVVALKDVYRKMLSVLKMVDLHQACVRNQLQSAVMAAGVQFESRHRRLLVNQGPRPDVGYERITAPFAFDQGLFKREKIRRMRRNFRPDA
ncbi:hypothetical protein SLS60_006550 [Paraconiothyrium brasiliense]|uniref:Uncharacterized protein n=1 Tax=Paraconiothyrium brasiliense TaxID=300254 RepID=A0ABR3RB13_9PLEO